MSMQKTIMTSRRGSAFAVAVTGLSSTDDLHAVSVGWHYWININSLTNIGPGLYRASRSTSLLCRDPVGGVSRPKQTSPQLEVAEIGEQRPGDSLIDSDVRLSSQLSALRFPLSPASYCRRKYCSSNETGPLPSGAS